MLPVTGFGQATCKHVHQVLAVVNNSSADQGLEVFRAELAFCFYQILCESEVHQRWRFVPLQKPLFQAFTCL